MNIYIKVLLLVPLYWYGSILNNLTFKWPIIPLIPSFDNAPAWFEHLFIPAIWFIGTPLSFVIGVIYTAYNKLWLWLFAYICFGGGLWFYLAF